MSEDKKELEMVELNSDKDISWIFDQYSGVDGQIAVSSFTDIVEKYRSTLSETTIKKLLHYADTNKDGFITKDELLRLESQDDEVIAMEAGVKIEELTKFRRGIKRVGNFILTNEDDKQLYYERYSCLPPPFFMISISLLAIIMYIYYGVQYGKWFTFSYKMANSPFIFDTKKREQVWRFFSYLMIHAGFEHVAFNVFVQLVLGVPLEMVHGSLRVSAVYMAGVVAGSLSSSIFDPFSMLVGASGGVYALFTAQLANVILNGDVMHKLSSLLRTVFVLLILAADFGYSIYRRFDNQVSGAKLSFVAHVAGALAGLSVGLIVLKNFKKSLRDQIVFWIAVGAYIGLMLFAIFWNIFWPGYYN